MSLPQVFAEQGDYRENELTVKHAEWMEEILTRHPDMTTENIHDILQEEIGQVFKQVLIDVGVYKCTTTGKEAFQRFIEYINFFIIISIFNLYMLKV